MGKCQKKNVPGACLQTILTKKQNMNTMSTTINHTRTIRTISNSGQDNTKEAATAAATKSNNNNMARIIAPTSKNVHKNKNYNTLAHRNHTVPLPYRTVAIA